MTPNPAKVVVILEELQIPYEAVYVELTELKEPGYESVNPNGRVPGKLTLYQCARFVAYASMQPFMTLTQTSRCGNLVLSFSTLSIPTIRKINSVTLASPKSTTKRNGRTSKPADRARTLGKQHGFCCIILSLSIVPRTGT
jgi:hypothetical protein